MRPLCGRKAFSLIEVVLATIVLAIIGGIAAKYAVQPRQKVGANACELQRVELQLQAELYRRTHGRPVSGLMTELSTSGRSIPSCPVDGRSYQFNAATGKVIPHSH